MVYAVLMAAFGADPLSFLKVEQRTFEELGHESMACEVYTDRRDGAVVVVLQSQWKDLPHSVPMGVSRGHMALPVAAGKTATVFVFDSLQPESPAIEITVKDAACTVQGGVDPEQIPWEIAEPKSDHAKSARFNEVRHRILEESSRPSPKPREQPADSPRGDGR